MNPAVPEVRRSCVPSFPARTTETGIIRQLLDELGILARNVTARPCDQGWCLTLQCRIGGAWRPLLLELTADALAAAASIGPARDALCLELDESLADCERMPR
jgi:hypothetical protein